MGLDICGNGYLLFLDEMQASASEPSIVWGRWHQLSQRMADFEAFLKQQQNPEEKEVILLNLGKKLSVLPAPLLPEVTVAILTSHLEVII